jgi:dipeptide transport system ATP-binding protein
VVPGQWDRPTGCLFSTRCAFVRERCRTQVPPPLSAALGKARCFYPLVHGVSTPVEELELAYG